MEIITYIAHPCPSCTWLVYIADGKKFVDDDYKPITVCPNCGMRLKIPGALQDIQAIEDLFDEE